MMPYANETDLQTRLQEAEKAINSAFIISQISQSIPIRFDNLSGHIDKMTFIQILPCTIGFQGWLVVGVNTQPSGTVSS